MIPDNRVEDGVGRRTGKSDTAFRTISEVSDELDVPQHVLRFWESKFTQIKPLKRGGGRRYYRPEDLSLLRRIRDLLYREGYTIRGVQNLLRNVPAAAIAAQSPDISAASVAAPLPPAAGPLEPASPLAAGKGPPVAAQAGTGAHWLDLFPAEKASQNRQEDQRKALAAIVDELILLRALLAKVRR